MPFQILDETDPRWNAPTEFVKGPDRLARQIIEHRRKKDERESFVTEEVTISIGPKNTAAKVYLKWPKSAQIVEERDDLDNVIARKRVWTNGRFVFAVYAENPDWHKAARDEWEAGARNAIEKFCAMKGASITFGPRQEDMNRYNIMVEVRDPLPGGEDANG